MSKGIAVLTQLYCLIHLNMSTTCFDLYGHGQVGYDIRGKTYLLPYSMVQSPS